MKVFLTFILITLSFTGYTQVCAINKLYGYNFDVAYDLYNLISTEDGDIVTLQMPDSLNEITFSLAIAELPLLFSGDSIRVDYKIKHINSSERYYKPFQVTFDNYSSQTFLLEEDTGVLIEYNSDWTNMSHKVAIPKDSKSIEVRLSTPFTGKCQISVSSIKIYIDEIEYDMCDKLKYKYLLDREFEFGSKINIEKLSKKEIDRLSLLCQVWVLLKYNHPAIATKFDYNWDYELFRIIPKILAAKNESQVENLLLDWVNSIGLYDKNNVSQESDHVIVPYNSSLYNNLNNAELKDKLREISKTKNSFNRYVKFITWSKVPNFGESEYTSIQFNDVGYRLLALFRYWGAMDYFYPHKYSIKKGWDTILKEHIKLFVSVKSDSDYTKAILSLTSALNDSHTYIDGSDIFGMNGHPVGLQYVENKVVVTNTKEANTILESGDIITRVNGKRITKIFKELSPYIGASNDGVKKRNLLFNLLRSDSSTIDVVYQHEGRKKNATLSCNANYIQLKNIIAKADKPDNIRIIDSVMYIYPIKFNSESLENFLNDTSKYKGIILDLRCYPHQDLSPISNHIYNKPTPYLMNTRTSFNHLGSFISESPITVGEINENNFKGKMVVLVNEYTQSAAEVFATSFQANPQTITIGSRTAGVFGDAVCILLPNGYSAQFTSIGAYYPDGKEVNQVGVRIDEIVKPTIKGIREGRDEVLERAIEIINSNSAK